MREPRVEVSTKIALIKRNIVLELTPSSTKNNDWEPIYMISCVEAGMQAKPRSPHGLMETRRGVMNMFKVATYNHYCSAGLPDGFPHLSLLCGIAPKDGL
jgi:hypothetical protein